ncbi:hypothetical protein TGPRC2_265175 [Toxoplasma gondii TgCatPRC2]|uniref:Uncharacterized protein n=3 Tax=Toxoplasma gondii TaxID=5811 RepID=A0A151H5W2_TOXGO|nr:hypothetical protein TGME49_265175 [Toxoplasma gondii ME49]EPT27745.1 hypothetical protein TGME49_265175 [Toxoplasma gondii ME49]KYF45392.1 hypothetical protein TGARI_265175 [Toxoplasma gondii ARI]KYK64745.1 hypothetical protein TGPRC2_265175 [Toxoplasma gondii TgCatPRC2]|eukprot:XP_018636308.1 hypothetical protein TGME49_265175 [Toxoplasma gondii ME49]
MYRHSVPGKRNSLPGPGIAPSTSAATSDYAPEICPVSRNWERGSRKRSELSVVSVGKGKSGNKGEAGELCLAAVEGGENRIERKTPHGGEEPGSLTSSLRRTSRLHLFFQESSVRHKHRPLSHGLYLFQLGTLRSSERRRPESDSEASRETARQRWRMYLHVAWKNEGCFCLDRVNTVRLLRCLGGAFWMCTPTEGRRLRLTRSPQGRNYGSPREI